MIYKTYNCNSFNIHTIKTDKFKTCHMEILFRRDIIKEQVGSVNFLGDIMSESSKKYPTNRDLVIRLEELYKAFFYCVTTKVGQTLTTNFVYEFISPEYIKEKNYLEDILQFPFEILKNPLVTNGEFDLKTFNIVKDRIKREIKGINESPVKLGFRGAFKAMDPDSPTSYSVLGTLEELDKITPSSLYELYKNLYKDCTCDIFIIGNLNMDEVVGTIRKNFNNRIINSQKREIYVKNKLVKKERVVEEEGNFIQSNLILIYNLDNLTKKERDIVFHIYNYIMGNGGLTSKLYKSIREENSLCYAITSMFLKYDNLLVIQLSLEKENVKKAVELIKKCLKSMIKGDFTEEDIENAKKNIIWSLNLSLDNNVSLINNYVFNIIDDLPLLEERKEAFSKVTKEEIIAVAKKIKLNTVYSLNGGQK